MFGLRNLAFKYRPAGESDILPILIDNHNTNPEGINDINDSLTIFQFLTKKFVVATRVLSGHVLHLKEFGKENTITNDGEHEGQEHPGRNITHTEIVANKISAITLILGAILFYTMGGLDVYTLPKLAVASIVLLYWSMVGGIGYSVAQVPILVYLVILFISTVLSDFPWLGVFGQSGSHSTGILPVVLTIAAFQAGHNSGKDIRKWFILGSLICGIVALAQQLNMCIPFGATDRSYGTMGNPVFCVGILSAGCVLSLAMGYKLIPIVMFASILSTNSRCGILALGVGSVFLLATKYRNNKLLLCTIASGLLIGVIYTQSSIINNRNKSDSTRRILAVVAIKAFASSPIIGVGPEQFVAQMQKYRTKEYDDLNTKMGASAYCHNSILETLMSVGVLGAIPLLAAMSAIFIVLYRSKDFAMMAVLLAIISYSLVQPLVASMKIPIAVLIGSAIDVEIESPKFMRGVYIVVMAVAMISTLSMFRSSRVMFDGAAFGNQGTFLKAYKYAAPNYERFVDREILRKQISGTR